MLGRAAVGVVLRRGLPTVAKVVRVLEARVLAYEPKVQAVRYFSSDEGRKSDIHQAPKITARDVCFKYFEQESSDEYWRKIGREGNFSLIDVLLIASGWDINKPLPSGHTLLMAVCQSGFVHPGTIKKLTESGADPNKQHRLSKDTALHYAVSAGDGQAVRTLLAHGAKCDILNCNKHSPEDVAKIRLDWARSHSGQDVQRCEEIYDMMRRRKIPQPVVEDGELVALTLDRGSVSGKLTNTRITVAIHCPVKPST